MHASFGLQPAIGVHPLDLQGRRLDAGLLARGLFDDLDQHAMSMGPAAVHPLQHLGPVLGLRAPRAGVDFDVAVVAVGLARQQRLQFGPGRLVL